jgi:hypothetical protein
MIHELYSKRRQMRWYDTENIPDFSIIQTAVEQAYELTASKQGLIPYKLYVLNNDKEINKGLYSISTGNTGTVIVNTNLLTAPYQFIYAARLVDDATPEVMAAISSGHLQPPLDPVEYKLEGQSRNTCLEIGMHATILSGLLMEQGLEVTYTLCFERDEESIRSIGLEEVDDYIYFIMSAGYADPKKEYHKGENKPPIENVVRYL